MKFKNTLLSLAFLATSVFASGHYDSIRGTIRDANGKTLAKNKEGFYIGLSARLGKDTKKLDKTLDGLKKVFYINHNTLDKLRYDFLSKDFKTNKKEYIKFLNFIPKTDMLKNAKLSDLPKSVKITPKKERYYMYSPFASHVVGYANYKEKINAYKGMVGVEKTYNDILENGNDITLSIDAFLQESIANIFGSKTGSVIIMNAEDGSILAGISLPNYDLNSFAQGITYKEWEDITDNPRKPFTNRLTNSLFPLGTIATFGSSLALLDSKKMDENTKVFCGKNNYQITKRYRCKKVFLDKNITMKEAIENECYQYFFGIKDKINAKELVLAYQKLGVGIKTDVDLPNEFNGRIFKQSKKGLNKFTSMVGFGEFLTTPIQMAKYTASIATGKSLTPHFRIKTNNTENYYEAKDKLSEFEKSKLPFFRNIMKDLGKDIKLKNPNIKVALKLAQIHIAFNQATPNISFPGNLAISYAPADNPKYIVTIVLDDKNDNKTMREFITKIYDKMIKFGYLK